MVQYTSATPPPPPTMFPRLTQNRLRASPAGSKLVPASIPIGMLAGTSFDPAGLARNLFWVSLGNIVGGGGGVALVYWTIYLSPVARGTAGEASARYRLP